MSKRHSKPVPRVHQVHGKPQADVAVADAPSVDAGDALDLAAISRSAHSALTPFEILDDYERRSLDHVVGLPEQLDAPGLWRGVGYRIGHKRLASGFNEVVEILPMPQV